MILHFKEQGSGQTIVIVHGLFGMLDNWQTIAKNLSDDFRVISVDLRNHGRSFHHPYIDYPIMAHDLLLLLDHLMIDKVHLLGHSMGGKVAMQFASDYPNRLNSLCIVDIVPISYERGHDDIFSAVLSLDIGKMSSRQDVELALIEKIPHRSVVQFLLKGLVRSDEGFVWRTNYIALYEHYDTLKNSPPIQMAIPCPTLLIFGQKSPYVDEQGIETARRHFLHLHIVPLDAGHWVHADRPDELLEIFKTFITSRNV